MRISVPSSMSRPLFHCFPFVTCTDPKLAFPVNWLHCSCFWLPPSLASSAEVYCSSICHWGPQTCLLRPIALLLILWLLFILFIYWSLDKNYCLPAICWDTVRSQRKFPPQNPSHGFAMTST